MPNEHGFAAHISNRVTQSQLENGWRPARAARSVRSAPTNSGHTIDDGPTLRPLGTASGQASLSCPLQALKAKGRAFLLGPDHGWLRGLSAVAENQRPSAPGPALDRKR